MSTEPLLYDLYTLFFSYTQSSLYRSYIRTLSSSIPSLFSSLTSSSSSSSSSTSRLQHEFVLYSQRQGAMSQSGLVTLSFTLFFLFLIFFPTFSLLSVSFDFHSSLFVYLSCLSTVYVSFATVVYSLVLLESLTKGVQSFPLTISSLIYLYFLNIGSFALAFYVMLATYTPTSPHSHSTRPILDGLDGDDGLINLVHTFYFSISTFTTVGFGDVTARWWLARLLVSLELSMSSLLHILVFSKGVDLIIDRRAQLSRQVGEDTFDANSNTLRKRE